MYTHYFRYLAWPKVKAKVKNISVVIKEVEGVIAPREVRVVTFSFTFKQTTCSTDRQSLWMRNAMPVSSQVGADVILCMHRELSESSPYRPIREFMATSMFAFIPFSFSILYWMFILDMPTF